MTPSSSGSTGASPSGEAREDCTNVVICGAGPAGLLLAHYLLSFGKNKFRVLIYDKGEDPRTTLKQGMNQRRYTMTINKRGQNCLKLVPELFEKFKEVAVDPDSVTLLLPFLKKPLHVFPKEDEKPGMAVDRFSLCAALLQALEDMHGDKAEKGLLSLNFNWACTQVDLQGQTVCFQEKWQGDGKEGQEAGGKGEGARTVTQSYDLLVGADGLHSAVRLAFQQQMRLFEVETKVIPSTWVLAHMPPPNEYPKGTIHVMPVIPDSGGISSLAAPGPDGTLCLIMGWIRWGQPQQWMACSTPEEAKAFFDTRLPYLHVPERVAWKLRTAPLQTTKQVKCWQYHDDGGHAVLVGDAAHATTPSIGQGCNSSLVDASVLARLLLGEAVGELDRAPSVEDHAEKRRFWAEEPSPSLLKERLPALLRYFSALQVKEGQAMVDLSDANAPAASWAKSIHGFILLLRTFLSKLLPFLVCPPAIGLLNNTLIPYSVAYRKLRLETDLFVWANESSHRQHEAEEARSVLSKGAHG